ncbi:MAG: uncharacterized protein JWP46_1840, partial [Modestobacter sp.]|nr:uncharacterized protein [Modestobacter sp.]
GTGWGGAAGQRGALLQQRLPVLREAADEHGYDVALVLRRPSDLSAAQRVRRGGVGEWDLPRPLRELAEQLGERARRGQLAVFLGAGVSAAAGLPTWEQLLDELATRAGLHEELRTELAELPPQDSAALLARELGRGELTRDVQERFGPGPYSLAHALIAGLPVEEFVTTNYDPLVELAAADLGRGLQVLPFEEATAGAAWLLKLHGDSGHPDSIVLTREQYLQFGDSGSALAGVLQSLLLTRHVLFVGTSMLDDDLIRIAHQVRTALARPGDGARPRSGTVLALREDPVRARLWERDVETVAMAPADVPAAEAARRLEVLLDLLGCLSSRPTGYLLDPAYRGLLDEAEMALAEVLGTVAAQLARGSGDSSAGQEVADLLIRLGHDLPGEQDRAGPVLPTTTRASPDHEPAPAADPRRDGRLAGTSRRAGRRRRHGVRLGGRAGADASGLVDPPVPARRRRGFPAGRLGKAAPMTRRPRPERFRTDDSIPMLAQGYAWLPDRRRAAGGGTVRTRLMGRRALGVEGPEAARFVYDEDHVRRSGALPEPVVSTLFGHGAVHTLDGEPHRVGKAMFVDLLTGDGVGALVSSVTAAWDDAVRRWVGQRRVVLFDEAGRVLTRGVCDWAGSRCPTRRCRLWPATSPPWSTASPPPSPTRCAASTRSPRSSAGGPRGPWSGRASRYPPGRWCCWTSSGRTTTRRCGRSPTRSTPSAFSTGPPAPGSWCHRVPGTPGRGTAAQGRTSPWRCCPPSSSGWPGWPGWSTCCPRRICPSRCAASPPARPAASSSPGCGPADRHPVARAGQ